MVISSARLRSYIHIPNIAYKTQIKYLGIYIDQNLHWGPQIQHISMFFAHSRDNATPYYNILGILKFENVYKFKVALFTHKILNGSTNISSIFHRTLTRASEIHNHNTRFASKLNFHRPKANNNYGTSTFAFVSSKLWETIPTNIKRLPYTSFFNQCKLYLLNTQASV